MQSTFEKLRTVLSEGRDVAEYVDGSPAPNKAIVLNQVIENIQNQVHLSMQTSLSQSSILLHSVLPLIRKILPNLFANELIGIQALANPKGYIKTLRKRIVTATDYSKLSPWDVAEYYKNPKSYTDILQHINKVTDVMLSEFVETSIQKFEKHWILDDISTLAKSISEFYDKDLIVRLRELAGKPTHYYKHDPYTGTAMYVGDAYAPLPILINRQANLIAARTRIAAGNRVIVSRYALNILQSETTCNFAKASEDRYTGEVWKYAGTLNNSMKVYVDLQAPDDADVLILLKHNEEAAPLIMATYNPLTTEVNIDPMTFEPVVNLLSENAFYKIEKRENLQGVAEDFIATIGVKI